MTANGKTDGPPVMVGLPAVSGDRRPRREAPRLLAAMGALMMRTFLPRLRTRPRIDLRIGLRAAIAVSLLGCVAGYGTALYAADMPVKAPPLAPAPAYNSWRFDITPYAWMPSLNGSSTIKGHTTDIDATFFGDLIHRKIPKQLFGLMTAFEARNDRFAILGDFTYLKLGASKSGQRSESLDPRLTLAAGANFETTIKMVITELAGAYELARWGSPSGSATAVDVYAGGRLWWQQAEASLNVGATLTALLPRDTFVLNGNRAYASSGDITWVDPLVGLRLRHQFTPGHELMLSGDVGGFGAGSDFSWQAVGAYRFAFAKAHGAEWSGMLGYRALYADYSKGSGATLYQFDMLQHGPIVGMSARF
jgi:hypothetical protein